MDRLLLGGDAEIKLGPEQSFVSTFSICHWNLNSISAHNYVKISLLKAYIMIQKFGNSCVSETYLDSNTSPVNNNLEFSGYNLILSDHLSNNK